MAQQQNDIQSNKSRRKRRVKKSLSGINDKDCSSTCLKAESLLNSENIENYKHALKKKGQVPHNNPSEILIHELNSTVKSDQIEEHSLCCGINKVQAIKTVSDDNSCSSKSQELSKSKRRRLRKHKLLLSTSGLVPLSSNSVSKTNTLLGPENYIDDKQQIISLVDGIINDSIVNKEVVKNKKGENIASLKQITGGETTVRNKKRKEKTNRTSSEESKSPSDPKKGLQVCLEDNVKKTSNIALPGKSKDAIPQQIDSLSDRDEQKSSAHLFGEILLNIMHTLKVSDDISQINSDSSSQEVQNQFEVNTESVEYSSADILNKIKDFGISLGKLPSVEKFLNDSAFTEVAEGVSEKESCTVESGETSDCNSVLQVIDNCVCPKESSSGMKEKCSIETLENTKMNQSTETCLDKAPSFKNNKSREEIVAEREAKKAAKLAAKKRVKDKANDGSNKTLEGSQKKEGTKSNPSGDQIKSNKETSAVSNIQTDSVKVNVVGNEKLTPVSTKGTICDVLDGCIIDRNIQTYIQEKVDKTELSCTPKAVQNEKDPSQEPTVTEPTGKSKAELRAERRAKQEAQRAAKAAQKESGFTQTEATKLSSLSQTKILNEKDNGKVKEHDEGKQIESSALDIDSPYKVKLFTHLIPQREIIEECNTNLHPAILQLGVQYKTRVIAGSNARCLALLYALKKMVRDYTTPLKQEFSRGLETMLAKSMDYINNCRPASVSMTNALRHIKRHLTQLPNNIPDLEAKQKLYDIIETYVREQIDVAGEAICNTLQKKIANGDVILTYGCSSLIFRILLQSHQSGTKFSVVIVDGGPWYEGREMLRRLVKEGLNCSYVLMTAASFIMREVSKVLLGAHALLANGYVTSRAGTSQVALLAHSYNVPVLVCCETHKFSERVQTDAFVSNELCDPDEVVSKRSGPISQWRDYKCLTPLSLAYDVTPPDLVTAVVTELGILPCTSVPVILRIKPSESV